jgi:L-arabinose transport system substrate-binding protein
MKKIAILVLLVMIAVTVPFAQGTKSSDPIKIGFLVKMPENSWFQDEWKFAQMAADQYGFELIKIGTPDGEKVLSAIEIWPLKKRKVLLSARLMSSLDHLSK